MQTLKIVLLIASICAVAVFSSPVNTGAGANPVPVPLPVPASLGDNEKASKSNSVVFLDTQKTNSVRMTGVDAREGRFWAPWSSVRASYRGRFHSGSRSY